MDRNRWLQKTHGAIPPTTKPCPVHWWKKLSQDWEKHEAEAQQAENYGKLTGIWIFDIKALKMNTLLVLTEKPQEGVSDTVKWKLVFVLTIQTILQWVDLTR